MFETRLVARPQYAKEIVTYMQLDRSASPNKRETARTLTWYQEPTGLAQLSHVPKKEAAIGGNGGTLRARLALEPDYIIDLRAALSVACEEGSRKMRELWHDSNYTLRQRTVDLLSMVIPSRLGLCFQPSLGRTSNV